MSSTRTGLLHALRRWSVPRVAALGAVVTAAGVVSAVPLSAAPAYAAPPAKAAAAAGPAVVVPTVAWVSPLGGLFEEQPGLPLQVAGVVPAAGTSPASTPWFQAGQTVAVHAASGTLQYEENAAGLHDTGVAMASGASPAIAGMQSFFGNGGNAAIAFAGSDGLLRDVTVNNGTVKLAGGVSLRVAPGTDPAVASSNPLGFTIAFQGADTGRMWYVDDNNVAHDTGLVMMSGTSPSITAVPSSTDYRIAFVGSDGFLKVYDTAAATVTSFRTQNVAGGTRPSIDSTLSGTFNVAFVGIGNRTLWLQPSTGPATQTSLVVAPGTSPSLASLGGTIQVLVNNATTHTMWEYTGGATYDTLTPIADNTSPSTAGFFNTPASHTVFAPIGDPITCTRMVNCQTIDIDHDGDPDDIAFVPSTADPVWAGRLVSADYDSTTRTFAAGRSFTGTTGCGNPARTCTFADADGDGWPDLVEFIRSSVIAPATDPNSGAPEGGAVFYWNDLGVLHGGVRGLSAPIRAGGQICFHQETCMLADVTGDGIPDAVSFVKSTSASNQGNVWVDPGLRGEIDRTDNPLSFATTGVTKWSDNFCTGNQVCALAAVSGGPGADAVAFDRTTGEVFVAGNLGTTFGSPRSWGVEAVCRGAEVCGLADFDGDGKLDAIAKDPDNADLAPDQVWVSHNNGVQFLSRVVGSVNTMMGSSVNGTAAVHPFDDNDIFCNAVNGEIRDDAYMDGYYAVLIEKTRTSNPGASAGFEDIASRIRLDERERTRAASDGHCDFATTDRINIDAYEAGRKVAEAD